VAMQQTLVVKGWTIEQLRVIQELREERAKISQADHATILCVDKNGQASTIRFDGPRLQQFCDVWTAIIDEEEAKLGNRVAEDYGEIIRERRCGPD